MKIATLGVAVAALVFPGLPVSAADVTINMVNKSADGKAMQFEPAFVKVAPGDTVHFVAKDKGHDSQSLDGGIPEGAEPWKGKMGADISVTVSQPGLYAVKCAPHVGMGMVALIQVGDDSPNLEAIKALKLPGKARTRMDELLGQVQ